MAQDTEGLGYNEDKLDGSEDEDGLREGSYEMKSDRGSECDSLSDEGSYSPRKAEVEMNESVTLEQGKFRKLEPNDRLGNGERFSSEDEDDIDADLEEEERNIGGDENPPGLANGDAVIADNELGDDSASETGSYHVNTDEEEDTVKSVGGNSDESDAEYDLDSDESSGQEDTMDEVELIRMRELKRQDNPELPDTVTKLVTPTGSRLYLVGTAHFSEKSQKDVSEVFALHFFLILWFDQT